jgi:hypothetical protein
MVWSTRLSFQILTALLSMLASEFANGVVFGKRLHLAAATGVFVLILAVTASVQET